MNDGDGGGSDEGHSSAKADDLTRLHNGHCADWLCDGDEGCCDHH